MAAFYQTDHSTLVGGPEVVIELGAIPQDDKEVRASGKVRMQVHLRTNHPRRWLLAALQLSNLC